MTSIELTGWAAATFMLVAFTPRNLQRLRQASLGPSVAFIVIAATTAAWPVLALHALLLSINPRRLLVLRTTSGFRPLALRPRRSTSVAHDGAVGHPRTR
jgi:hypothetical protein